MSCQNLKSNKPKYIQELIKSKSLTNHSKKTSYSMSDSNDS